MYKLNGEKITAKRADELVEDLAMFPQNKDDLRLSIEERKDKYKKILEKDNKLPIADSLLLIKE